MRSSATSAAASHIPSMIIRRRGSAREPRAGQVVEIGRGRHHRLVNLGKLLLGAVTLDAHLVAQVVVASRHRGIDAEEAPEVDLALTNRLSSGDSVVNVLGPGRRPFLLPLQLLVVSGLFRAVALGTLKTIIRFAHQ